jgi:transposase-like protein
LRHIFRSMTAMNESLLKTDRQGRLRYTPEQKKTMVDAYQASGLSAPRFAALHGVNYQTLIYWIKKSKTKQPTAPLESRHPALLSLIPAEIDHAPVPGTRDAVEVLLSNGVKLLITSPSQVNLCVTIIRELSHSLPC